MHEKPDTLNNAVNEQPETRITVVEATLPDPTDPATTTR